MDSSHSRTSRTSSAEPNALERAHRTARWLFIAVLLSILVQMWNETDLIEAGSRLVWKSVSEPHRPAPLTAADVERVLPHSITSRDPVLNVSCVDGEDGWNYVCAYQIDPVNAALRLKVGVTVGTTRIIQVSRPHVIGTPLPPPWQPGNRSTPGGLRGAPPAEPTPRS